MFYLLLFCLCLGWPRDLASTTWARLSYPLSPSVSVPLLPNMSHYMRIILLDTRTEVNSGFPSCSTFFSTSICAAGKPTQTGFASTRLRLNLFGLALVRSSLSLIFLCYLKTIVPAFTFSTSVNDLGVILDSHCDVHWAYLYPNDPILLLSFEAALSHQETSLIACLHHYCSRLHL